MALKPVIVDKQSPFMGEDCALCKQPLAPGDEIVICPEDAARHHVHCWRANRNKCSAYGCMGRGEIDAPQPERERRQPSAATPSEGSRVKTMPSGSFHCAQSCLLIAIAVAIVFTAIGCFGLWAILDYVMLEILGWQYRDPLLNEALLRLATLV